MFRNSQDPGKFREKKMQDFRDWHLRPGLETLIYTDREFHGNIKKTNDRTAILSTQLLMNN